MDEPGIAVRDLSERLVDAIIADFPDHDPRRRPVHTVGIGVTGTFQASPVARNYCTAEHFQGAVVPVSVRFSNSSGSPVQHDGWSDVRGMATRFHLAGDAATDLVTMTLREFFSATVDEFFEFTTAARMSPVTRQSPWSKIGDLLRLKPPMLDPMPGQTASGAAGSLNYANHHRVAQLGVFDAATIGAPTSYARATYNAVHTFIVTGPDRTRRYVRFMWQPTAGIKLTKSWESPVDDYLPQELRDRLAYWPAQFMLLMTIGEAGDAFDDPTIPWPFQRRRVVLGTMTLIAVAEDQVAGGEKLAFNPCRLVPGIELSNDPILAARKGAYEASRLRRGGTFCPFHDGAA